MGVKKIALLFLLGLVPVSWAAGAATTLSTCNATLQGLGMCSAAQNGASGTIVGFWASNVDAAPADPDVAADSADLRDALCATYGIPAASCTSAAADGALRKYLERLVANYRREKKQAAVSTTTPALDGQQNP